MSLIRNVMVGIIMLTTSTITIAQHYDGYGNPYPGQEQYMHHQGAEVERYYHPRQDYGRSHRWLEHKYQDETRMRGRAEEWSSHGRYGQSPYERECNRVGCR